ncbi:MAG: acetamidase, partial [Chloroflexi bacterium]|nr:acetamidase [Chloroflexota bacterium]
MFETASGIHVSRDQFHLAWDPAIEPIETVASGAIVEFDCLDASGGQLTADSTEADLATLDFNRVDQVNGPIAVAGLEAGGSLQIDVLELATDSWGWTAIIPGFGLLSNDFPNPAYKVTRLTPGAARAEFWPGIELPLAPFCGEMGVAPR